MAYWTEYTFSTVDQCISDLNTFVSANGWTVDYFGTYGSYNRLHIHKGSAHFDIYGYSTSVICMVACTGYDSGQGPTTQPNATTYKQFFDNLTTTYGNKYIFISTENAIYAGRQYSSTLAWHYSVIGTISNTIDGTESEGFLMIGMNGTGTYMFNNSAYATGTARIGSSWSPFSLSAGAISGYADKVEMRYSFPCTYNAGILPLPVMIAIVASSTSYRIPFGFAPEFYIVGAGNVYEMYDEITIGTDTFLLMPETADATVDESGTAFMFKLGS